MKILIFATLLAITAQAAAQTTPTPCMLVGTVGQSNGDPNGYLPQSPVLPVSDGDGACYTTDGINVSLPPLRDPVQGKWNAPLYQKGTLWPMLGHTLHVLTGSRINICNGNTGGVGWTWPDWYSLTGSSFTLFVNKIRGAQATIAANGDTCPLSMVVMLGGTSDALYSRPQAMIVADMEQLIANIRATFNAPNLPMFVIDVDTNPTYAAQMEVVRAAQYQVIAETPNTYLVSGFFNFTAIGWVLPDGWHYTQSAFNVVGADAAVHIAKIMGY